MQTHKQQPPTSCDTWEYRGIDSNGRARFIRTSGENGGMFSIDMDRYSLARLAENGTKVTYQFRLTCDQLESGF